MRLHNIRQELSGQFGYTNKYREEKLGVVSRAIDLAEEWLSENKFALSETGKNEVKRNKQELSNYIKSGLSKYKSDKKHGVIGTIILGIVLEFVISYVIKYIINRIFK